MAHEKVTQGVSSSWESLPHGTPEVTTGCIRPRTGRQGGPWKIIKINYTNLPPLPIQTSSQQKPISFADHETHLILFDLDDCQ